MVMTDHNSPMCRIVHRFENIRAQSLAQVNVEKEVLQEEVSLTCEVWITVRSFIRENPASILPRRPAPTVSDHQVYRLSNDPDLRSQTRFFSFEQNLIARR